jgi:LysM repeat protein
MELVVPVNPKATASVDPEPAPAPAPAPTKASSSPAPAAPVSKGSPAVVHVVRSGDTLGSIAAKYGVSTSQVQSWNKLSGTKILVGQKLIVKPATSGGSSSSSSASASKPTTSGASASSASTPKGKVITYTVRRGDTLSTIADRYNCSVSDIKAWNGLRGSTIYPGQKLKIKG